MEYKNTGRDSLVFLVDASKEMFVKGEDGEPSNFDMTMQVLAAWKYFFLFFFFFLLCSSQLQTFTLRLAVYKHVCVFSYLTWRVFVLKCVRSVYMSKIISSDRDLVALVFYGTEKCKNPKASFKHVYIYHDLDTPGKEPKAASSYNPPAHALSVPAPDTSGY